MSIAGIEFRTCDSELRVLYVSEINVAGSLLFMSNNFVRFAAINPDNKAYICPVYLTANREIFSLQSRLDLPG